MDNSPFLNESPQETADKVARDFFKVTDDQSRRVAIRQCLVSIPWITLLVPGIFYLRFNEVGALGWGTTVFFDVYCLLSAIGLYFRPRTEYHSPVALRGDLLDRIGAFWLVACLFGPFLGWIVTSVPLTANSWGWLYAARIALAAGAPLFTALPLTRYVRGKSSWVALPLLLCVTLLPVSTGMNVSRDLWEGPVKQQSKLTGRSELYLKHTERHLPDAPVSQ